VAQCDDILPLPEVFYCVGRSGGQYFFEAKGGRWISVDERSIRRHLKERGFPDHHLPSEPLSKLERVLNQIQLEQNVDYAAPLAGYRAGRYQINSRPILVTDSPKLIQPVAGEWPILRDIFQMFVDPIHDQRPYFFGWLKQQQATLRAGQWQPGQALVIAGPVDTGKSLVQLIITDISGGRSANCFAFMTDRTSFNSDLFRAEHLTIEDNAESADIRTRRHFGAVLKQFCVNQNQNCHGKHQVALTLTPFWRLSISVNDDPERLLVLPPIDPDIADKIILLKVHWRPMPMPTASPDEKAIFWKAIQAELPAFVHFLLGYEIPVELRSPRFGITHFHHPELLAALNELSPETRLLGLIDQVIFGPSLLDHWNFPGAVRPDWTGTASELTGVLTSDGKMGYEARRLLPSSNACGNYLRRLANQWPDRVIRGPQRNGIQIWLIRRQQQPATGGASVLSVTN
jgi:hypothetical protein